MSGEEGDAFDSPLFIQTPTLEMDAPSTSRSAVPPKNLLDLHPDVLQRILRYIPLEDKMCILYKMPEFKPFLEHRASYLDCRLPFSFNYLRYFNLLRTGWYADRDNWGHRVCLLRNESTLQFTLHHFLIDGYRGQYTPNARGAFYKGTLERMQEVMDTYFNQYQWMEDMQLFTYHLPRYGYIMINFSPYLKVQEMRFFDRGLHEVETNVPTILRPRNHPLSHFSVLIRPDKRLLVECILPPNAHCRCPSRLQELTPFTFGVSEGHRFLTREGGEPIPYCAYQKLQLEEDAKHITCIILYHVNRDLKNTVKLTPPMKRHPELKRLLEEGNPFYKRQKLC